MAFILPETYIPNFHDLESVKKMPYNPLGKTGLKVSKLGLGTSQLALCYKTNFEREGIETVVEAVKSGINYIDTAPFYGEGKSETVLGKALRLLPRESYYLATKIGRYTADPATMFDFSAEKTYKSVQESLARLGVSYVDVLQIHDIEFAPSLDILINETLPALQKIKESGLAKFIGITGYPISKLQKLYEGSKVSIDAVLSYCRYTLFDTALQDYIEFFKNHELGIINAAALGMGLLTDGGPPTWHPATESIKTTCREAAQFCKKNGFDISKLGAAYSLSHPDIATHLIGMPNCEVLHKNLQLLHDGLTNQEINCQHQILERYFKTMVETHWEDVEVKKYWEFKSAS